MRKFVRGIFVLLFSILITTAVSGVIFLTVNLSSYLGADVGYYSMGDIADALTRKEDGSFTLRQEVADRLSKENTFLILLNENGKEIWKYNKPEEIADSFSALDIAKFSRWYLNDYPVTVWV